MFQTANNERIRQGCLALDRRKIGNLQGIETGDTFEGMRNISGSTYGGEMMGSGRRKTREREYETSSMMPLPTNTNLPRGVTSTLNSNRYLPIKQSGAFQTPVNVSQFYHDGGIQGAGGEADIEKVEGGSHNVTSDLAGRMSELSGFGKCCMDKLLVRLKKKIRGGAWYDSLYSGIKNAISTVADVLPKAIGVYNDNKDNIAKAGEYFNKAKDFLAPKNKAEEKPPAGRFTRVTPLNSSGRGIKEIFGDLGAELAEALAGGAMLNDNQLDRLAEAGKIEYNGSGIFSSMLGMMGLGKVQGGGPLSQMLGMMGLGHDSDSCSSDSDSDYRGGMKDDGVSVKNQPEFLLSRKGGYSMNIKKPIPVVREIIDLRGNERLPQDIDSKFSPMGEEVLGGKRCCFNSKTCNGTEHYRNPPRKTPKKPRVAKKGKGAEVSMPATIGGAGLSKAKMRGMVIKKIMKDKGLTLGQASKYLAEQTRMKGSGFFDDLLSGIQKGIGTVAPLLPYIL